MNVLLKDEKTDAAASFWSLCVLAGEDIHNKQKCCCSSLKP